MQVTASPDFSFTLTPSTVTTDSSHQTATTQVVVTPLNGYTGTLKLGCSNLPIYAGCSATPTSFTFTSSTAAAQTGNLTFSISYSQLGEVHPMEPSSGTMVLYAGGLPISLLAIGLGWRNRRKQIGRLLVALGFLVCVSIGVSGCGLVVTPSGTYTIPVTLTDGTLSHTVNLTAVVN